MKETSPEKKAYKQALSELREHYKEELKNNIDELIAIRGDPKVGANVKVDAIRYLNQMLGVPRSPQERTPDAPPPKPGSDAPASLTLRPELLEELDRLTKH